MTMDFVKLTKEKLDIESIYNMVLSPEYGAVSLFVGTTRNNFDGKTVIKLEYEAYEGMAVKALEKICKNVREKFNVGNIAIYHRLGEVPVQEASVVIAMSSPHRKDVLEAVPFAIDALKADVPIWKKEIYEGDQAPQWKENAESAEVMINNVNITEPVELYEEVVEDDPVENVPSDMIQINANLQEINRRINSFINRKRQQVNISNIQDFCLDRSDYNESTCARVDAVLMRRKDSKSHLKIHRVENIVGPQTQPFDACNSFDGPELRPAIANCPPGAEERLKNAEHYLGINRSSLDVFQRLKAIEDKILYLESVSPEYFDFVKQEKQGKILNPAKRTFSSTELDLKLQELEHKLLNKPGISGL